LLAPGILYKLGTLLKKQAREVDKSPGPFAEAIINGAKEWTRIQIFAIENS